jgi:hypothetical protein
VLSRCLHPCSATGAATTLQEVARVDVDAGVALKV